MQTIRKGHTLELEISDAAYGGKGIAKIDGFAVFVNGVAPLDLIKAKITKKKKNYAEARLVEIVRPSPFRTKPPCPYSGYCGGCVWQFLAYDQQLVLKRRHVAESLAHIGFIRDALIHPTIPSDLKFGYRNKTEFTFGDRRWFLPNEAASGADAHFALGYHAPNVFHKIIDIETCLLHKDIGNRMLNDVKAFAKHSGLPVYGLKTHEGFWRFLMLRYSSAYHHWMINIITASEHPTALKSLAEKLVETYPEIISVVNNITARHAGISAGEYEILLAGEPKIKDKIGAFEFEISANSFFQTNSRGAEILYNTVKDYADLSGSGTVLDLYSGTGTIALYVADAAKEVVGMEIAESAVADAIANAERNGVSNCRFLCGDIRMMLSSQTKTPDVLIIDPPRMGMHKDVLRQVTILAPPRIVYVSCNPATLARDLAVLKDSYRIAEVQPVDMFPHTYHIESVVRLEKN